MDSGLIKNKGAAYATPLLSAIGSLKSHRQDNKLKNIFPHLQIYAALNPQETAQIVDLFLAHPKRGFTRRMLTPLLPGISTHCIRKALEELLENEILTLCGHYYRLRIKPATIAPMVPVRLSKVEIQIMHQLNKRQQITASDVDVERSVFLTAARRLMARGLLETFESKPKLAVRRYYKFKRQEATIHD